MNKVECLNFKSKGNFYFSLFVSFLEAVLLMLFLRYAIIQYFTPKEEYVEVIRVGMHQILTDINTVLVMLLFTMVLAPIFHILNLGLLGLFTRLLNYMHTLHNYFSLCYLPVTVEDIDNLGLDIVEDYVYELSTILNDTQNIGKKDTYYTYNGVSGYKVPKYLQKSINEMFRMKYSVDFKEKPSEFYKFLRFVTSKKDAEGLCKAYLCDNNEVKEKETQDE